MTTSSLVTCAPGFETHLKNELEMYSISAEPVADGLLVTYGSLSPRYPMMANNRLCFPRRIVFRPQEHACHDSSRLAQNICDFFCNAIQDESIFEPWPIVVDALRPGLLSAKKMHLVKTSILSRLKKAVSRVAKLGFFTHCLSVGPHRGLYVFFADQFRVYLGRSFWSGGQTRMRMQKGAPSRSFLKLEEAYRIFGKAPRCGEHVLDLGAAPGGWSYSAAQRQARVIAVDNGSLKAGAKNHLLITHVKQDAYHYHRIDSRKVDWLLCDLVDQPHQVLDLLTHWLKNHSCRHFIANLKFGHSDPIDLLMRIHDPAVGPGRFGFNYQARHLYHDRQEITVLGELIRPMWNRA